MASGADMFDGNKANKLMDLYSRQIGAYGLETMKQLAALRVLVVGLRGVGVETAKNLVLAGPATVSLFDPEAAVVADQGSNFYLNAESVGKPRDQVCQPLLEVLNPNVVVNVLEESAPGSKTLAVEQLAGFGAVIVTSDRPLAELRTWNDYCHANGITFILALTNGVTGSFFSDFGPEHKVTDANGEPVKNVALALIQKEEVKGDGEGAATTTKLLFEVAKEAHGFDDGQRVKFEDVDGMVELNQLQGTVERVYSNYTNEQGKPAHRLTPNRFHLRLAEEHADRDVATFSAYTRGGYVTEVKPSRVMQFRPLTESLVNPVQEGEYAVKHPHGMKFIMHAAGNQLHFARLALWEFQAKHGALPDLHSQAHADECVELAKGLLAEHRAQQEKGGAALVVDELCEKTVRRMALYARAELGGLAAFLGGVAAQEVVKKFGKYTPTHQWFHVDYFELLSDEVPADAAPRGSRYDHQIAVLGAAFQEQLGKQTWFMVGCGALGCEYLKGFALMGVGADGGCIHVTDMDRIEVSNLNRQFLFRKENVGQQKSVCAANAARVMNPDMNIVCHEKLVGPDSENHFDDAFWDSLDGVCNALDNVKARRYVDSRCVFYQKPLLESGTLGTKANSEIIVPHKTQCYRDNPDTDDKDSIPMCTLRNFPNIIEHCIEWARAQFTDIFEDPPSDARTLLTDPARFFKQVENESNLGARLQRLRPVTAVLRSAVGADFGTCIRLAFTEFNTQYRNRIKDLQAQFPADSTKKDKDTGVVSPFWSGAKRFPRAVDFSLNDELNFQYLYCASNLYAFVFGLEPVRDHAAFRAEFAKAGAVVPDWQAKKVSMYDEEEEEEKSKASDDDEVEVEQKEYDDLIAFLKAFDHSTITPIQAHDFEKDDDTNFHIDFTTACSNMRAWNYQIKVCCRGRGDVSRELLYECVCICVFVALLSLSLSLSLEVSVFSHSRALFFFSRSFFISSGT
jgi:ubiquitin-activating enzyme E1